MHLEHLPLTVARRTLLQFVEGEGSPFPRASTTIKKNVYVDDLISGHNSIEEAIELREELDSFLQKGFPFPKVFFFFESKGEVPGSFRDVSESSRRI